MKISGLLGSESLSVVQPLTKIVVANQNRCLWHNPNWNEGPRHMQSIQILQSCGTA